MMTCQGGNNLGLIVKEKRNNETTPSIQTVISGRSSHGFIAKVMQLHSGDNYTFVKVVSVSLANETDITISGERNSSRRHRSIDRKRREIGKTTAEVPSTFHLKGSSFEVTGKLNLKVDVTSVINLERRKDKNEERALKFLQVALKIGGSVSFAANPSFWGNSRNEIVNAVEYPRNTASICLRDKSVCMPLELRVTIAAKDSRSNPPKGNQLSISQEQHLNLPTLKCDMMKQNRRYDKNLHSSKPNTCSATVGWNVAFKLSQLILQKVESKYGCGKSSCVSCTRSSSWLGQCRWCRRDNKCHNRGSLMTPCSRAENIVKESNCGDQLSRYDTALSLKMLMLSSAAYDPVDPEKCLKNALPSSYFYVNTVVVEVCDMLDHSCSGYIAVSHTEKAIAISFRGSVDLGQALAVFLKGISTVKVSFLDGRVQRYWKTAFDILWPNMTLKVKELHFKYPLYKIWVTGHSLGGAIASLASTWLAHKNIAPRKDIILYTFGMPRVGDYDYALQHDQLVNNSWRVVNYDDLVPHFPSLASILLIGGPYHHGVEAYYKVSANSVNSPHKECHGKPFNEDTSCSFTTFPYSIERHKEYFGVDVGTFFKKQCVLSSIRRKRDDEE